MSFDYDLVVIGSTQEGIYAASKAASLKARVALVTQSAEEYLNDSSFIFSRCLNEITNSLEKIDRNIWGFPQLTNSLPKVTLNEIENYCNLITENIRSENSLADLAILGVDVIYGEGEFCRLPKEAFLVNNRQLRSRNYLLATGAKYQIKPEYQTDTYNCWTPDNLWQTNLALLPECLLIIGNSHRSLELAQGLAKLGKKITLIAASKRLLPNEAVEAERLFQAQLAADRIKFILDISLKEIQRIDDRYKIKLGNINTTTEAIIFTDTREPNILKLNLEGVKVKYFSQGILVNNKLQTTNKSIYACGDLLGGNSLPHMAQYEVDIALKNMFSFPWFSRDYRYLSIVMLTQPSFARVGLSNIDRLSNSNNIYVVKQSLKSISKAQISGVTTGWCQIIVKANGSILGCTIVSDRAEELINIVAMMMRHKIKLDRNPIRGLLKQQIPYVTSSYSELFNRLAIAFQKQKIQRSKKLQNRLETWFDWRR